MAGRSIWLFIREMREHIQTQHGYLIWGYTPSSHQRGVWFSNQDKVFERCCTVVCRAMCNTMGVQYSFDYGMTVCHADKHTTLSLIRGWDWTQEETIIPIGRNGACDVWLGCFSGLLYTAVIRWCLRWFCRIFTKRNFSYGVRNKTLNLFMFIFYMSVCIICVCL